MTGPVRRTTAAVVLLLALVGCSSQEERYCDALEDEESALAEAAESGSGDVLTPTLASFQRLREAAPEELADEWDTVVRAWESLAEAAEAAGVDPSTYDPEAPPDGVSRDEARRLTDVAEALQSARVVQAAKGIEDHARQACDVDFAT